MARPVRIQEDIYDKIEAQAKQEHRSVTLMTNILLANSLNLGYATPTKVLVYDSEKKEEGWVEKPVDFQKKSEASLIQDVFGGEQLDIVEDFETLKRTPQVIRSEIRKLEQERDYKLAYCQDEETAEGIRINYNGDIEKLWLEYREVKG
jgi:hypothetical protein